MGQHRQFAMRSHAPRKVTRKVQALAKLPWLALKHDDEEGGNWVGCVACYAYAQERPHKARPNIYADFSIGAANLLDTKAAVLLRHAHGRLRLQAVASLRDVPRGAQVNVTSSVAAPALTRLRVSVWHACAAGALGGRFWVGHAG